jgi:DNA-binding YbaB/EbfC family protein
MAKGPGGMGGMFREAQKQAMNLQKRLGQLQQELKERVYEGTSGGGMVTVHVNGQREVLAVKNAPEVVDPEDVEMLEDLVTAAVSQALKQAEEAYKEEMSRLTGGLPIPGLL